MIRVLIAINLGLSIAVAFAIVEALAPPPRRRRTVGQLLKDQRLDDLAEMIVDLSHSIEAVDTTITPAEIAEVEAMLGFEPLESITITGRYGGWPYDTITEDAVN